MAGGAEAVDKVSQGRIDQARKKALVKIDQQFKANENRKTREQRANLQEDDQQFRATQAEQEAQRRQQELQQQNDYSRQNNWSTVTGADGSLYRVNPTLGETEQIAGGERLAGQGMSEREKLAVESLNAEIDSIYKSAEALGGELTPEMQRRVDSLSMTRNQMLFGSSLPSYNGGSGGGPATPEPEGGRDPGPGNPPQANGFGGLLNQAQQMEQQQSQQAEVDALEAEAEEALDLLNARPRMNEGPRPYAVASDEPTPQSIENAKRVRDKLMNLDPEMFNRFSDRQKANITGIIRDINQQLQAQ